MDAYSKRPIWQWIVVYAVVGAVVYGAIYYFFLAKKGTNINVYNSPSTPGESKFNSSTPAPTPNPTIVEKQKKGEEVSIFLTPSGFVPSDLTIKAGAKVIWTNQSEGTGDVSSAPHPAHTDYPALNLGNFGTGQSVSLTFNTPGTYKYHNHLNPSQFGSVTVK